MLIEEKQIPYRIVKLPLNAYGYKPEWYTRRVDGGKLPAVELDGGELILESLTIMRKLDDLFPSNGNGRMAPLAGSTAVRAETLMQLEAEVQQKWFSFVFYPVENEKLDAARAQVGKTHTRLLIGDLYKFFDYFPIISLISKDIHRQTRLRSDSWRNSHFF